MRPLKLLKSPQNDGTDERANQGSFEQLQGMAGPV